MAMLQVQARALGDPTRHEIFRFLDGQQRPVPIAELVEHLGINHTAVRQHLSKLIDARLVVASRVAPTGRGRPRFQYEVTPSADSRWGVAGPYERLAMLLSEVVRTGDTPEEVGYRAGLRLRGDAGPADRPVEAFAEQMARQGFEPTVDVDGTTAVIALQACPFANVALADPGTVCQLHRGLADGLAESVGGMVVEDLDVRDPREAACGIRCRVDQQHSTE